MSPRVDRYTSAIALMLVLGALLACKRKKDEPPPSVSAAPAATPEPVAVAPATAPAPSAAEPTGPKLGDVKRYPDREIREDEAAVKTLEESVKVYNEADANTAEVATLPKDLAVVRLASLEKEAFMLVDFPSGIGQFSQGWVEKKFLEAKGTQLARDKVLSQEKKASIAPTSKPAATGSAKPTASASAAPATSASAAAALATASAAAAAAAKSAAPILSAAKTAIPIDPRAAAAAANAAAAAAQGGKK